MALACYQAAAPSCFHQPRFATRRIVTTVTWRRCLQPRILSARRAAGAVGTPAAEEAWEEQQEADVEERAIDASLAEAEVEEPVEPVRLQAPAAAEVAESSEYSTETEILIVKPELSPVESVVASVRETGEWLTTAPLGKGVSLATAALLLSTLAVAVYRTYKKSTSQRAIRKKVVDRNRQLVEALGQYLPDKRSGLSPSVAQLIARKSRYTGVEAFRKYLWYVLRERKFDEEALDDLVTLKGALALNDDQVAEALQERAERVYKEYGTLMLNTEGMTAAGIERKATCTALFKKMLYLTEWPDLIRPGSDAAAMVNLGKIFGATEDDCNRLRLVSLREPDMEALDRMASAADPDDADMDAPGTATSS